MVRGGVRLNGRKVLASANDEILDQSRLQSLLKKEGDVCSFSNDNGRKIIFHAKGDEGADRKSLIKKRILSG